MGIFDKKKKYVVEMRGKFDDSLLEEVEEFDSYEDARWAAEEAALNFAEGANVLEMSGRDYTDPNEVYFKVSKR
ncbi:hypothetical protein [Salirhabdus salicampi]|uniref:hypothetical protein n=1 Tax=Salirhabdus salicampi TaxID=476102 RepID=UPI0020C3ADE7|nr:hypothetical protein [Salirhabdus salicampi]MCP8616351.1 hypothetical protein [Salirhabdus salicampi]